MDMRRFGWVIVLGAALCACDGQGSKANSSVTPQERIAQALDVCADPKASADNPLCKNESLARINQDVNTALVAEAANVSESGGQMLVQNELRWREAQRVACGIIDRDAAPNADQTRCLEQNYRARLAQARDAVQEVGGYTFQRVEQVDAAPVTAEIAAATGAGDEAPPAITRDIRFPRIDGPQTPQVQRFNELVAQQPQYRLEDATNEVVTYQIAYAGPELISVRFDMAQDRLGAVHGDTQTKPITVVMTTGEPLKASDVFKPNSGWEAFVTQRAVRTIRANLRTDYPDFAPSERDVRDSATKEHLWLITEDALVILLPPYSFGGSYDMGGQEVRIPWADLARFLNPEAPAPIRRES